MQTHLRVYPQGVSKQQISQRVSGLGGMLYLLGSSYGAVEIMYRAVQTVAEKVTGMKQAHLLEGYRTGVMGADVTSVDAMTGMTLSIDGLPGEEAEQLKTWLEPIWEAVDADVLVADVVDAFKKVSDETRRAQQVCKSHVVRNTEALVEEPSALIQIGLDRSLETIGVCAEQALADLVLLKKLIHLSQPEEQPELEQSYMRYAMARKLTKGRRFNVAYRMRNLFLDR